VAVQRRNECRRDAEAARAVVTGGTAGGCVGLFALSGPVPEWQCACPCRCRRVLSMSLSIAGQQNVTDSRSTCVRERGVRASTPVLFGLAESRRQAPKDAPSRLPKHSFTLALTHAPSPPTLRIIPTLITTPGLFARSPFTRTTSFSSPQPSRHFLCPLAAGGCPCTTPIPTSQLALPASFFLPRPSLEIAMAQIAVKAPLSLRPPSRTSRTCCSSAAHCHCPCETCLSLHE
jgi:hypothetical protein